MGSEVLVALVQPFRKLEEKPPDVAFKGIYQK